MKRKMCRAFTLIELLVDIHMALNLTAAGIVAHESSLKGGEWLKIPQYKL